MVEVDEPASAEKQPGPRTDPSEETGASRGATPAVPWGTEGESESVRREGQAAGLLASAAKSLAELSAVAYDEARDELRACETAEEFHAVLARLPLGLGERGRERIRADSQGDAWEDARARLVQLAEASRHNRLSPSS
jgi:hypothetical protein